MTLKSNAVQGCSANIGWAFSSCQCPEGLGIFKLSASRKAVHFQAGNVRKEWVFEALNAKSLCVSFQSALVQ